MKLKERAKQLKNQVPMLWFAFKYPKTPWLAITVTYALSPIVAFWVVIIGWFAYRIFIR